MASVGYFNGKHVPLYIAGLLILIVGFLYTSLLFFWQWFLYHQNKVLFWWVRNQKLCQFLEPYHAPFILKHRYFTGLLLFARVILYIVFALNMSGDPGVNLLSIIVIVSGILLLKGYYGQLYKNKVIDTIEILHYLNTVIFSAAKLYTFETKNAQTISDHVSGTIMFALFLTVLTYHIFTESQICLKLLQWFKRKWFNRKDEALMDNPPVDSDITDPPEPTWSSIELPSCKGKPLSSLILVDQAQMPTSITNNCQDNASKTLASLSIPVLETDGNTNNY